MAISKENNLIKKEYYKHVNTNIISLINSIL